MKRNALVLLLAILITGFGISSVNASVICANATVKQTGVVPSLETPTTSKYQITIRCNAKDWGTGKTYLMIPEVGDAGYATALTAMTTGYPVNIKVSAVITGSLLEEIFLLPAPAL